MWLNRKRIFLIFIFVSLLFTFSGIYSAYTLATIERQRTSLITLNPQDVRFYMELNATSYNFTIHFKLVNEGPYSFGLFKIRWAVYLVNGSTEYQANDYQRYYPEGDRIMVLTGHTLSMTIVDNTTTHQWYSWLMPHLKWQIEKHGLKNITWHNVLEIKGMLGNFNGEEYQYNVRTWYLWHLPEVEIRYDKNIQLS